MEGINIFMDSRVKYSNIIKNNSKISSWIELDLIQIAKMIFNNVSKQKIDFIIVSLLPPGEIIDFIQISNSKEGNYKNILMTFTFDNEIIFNSPQYNSYTDNPNKINKILLLKCIKALLRINDIDNKKLCKDFLKGGHSNFEKYLLNNLDFLNRLKNNGIANLYSFLNETDLSQINASSIIEDFNKRFISNHFDFLSDDDMKKYGVILLLISILNSNENSSHFFVESVLIHVSNKENVKFVFNLAELEMLIKISSKMNIFEFLNNLITENKYSILFDLDVSELELFKSKLDLYEYPYENYRQIFLYNNSFDWLGKRIIEKDDYNKFEFID